MRISDVNMQQIPSAFESDNQRTLINILFGNNNKEMGNNRDIFVRSTEEFINTYSPSATKHSFISEEMLIELNNVGVNNVSISGDIVKSHGKKFNINQIPPVCTTNLKEVKAQNNVMDFGNNNFFKYVSKVGAENYLFTSELGSVSSIYSECLRGAPYNRELERYASFWRSMLEDPTYIGLSYDSGQVREYLGEAGVKTGFFTVKMGGREATQFYSATKTGGVLHSKHRYDQQYEVYVSKGHILRDCAPGTVFKVEGKEYVLSENHTLDIPIFIFFFIIPLW